MSIRHSYLIEPLANHDREGFSCGVEALDRYLKQQAGQENRRHVSNCFVAVHSADKSVGGYYTLSATSILLKDLPGTVSKKLPRYPEVPAALVGRLAVDTRHHGRRLGEHLMLDGMSRVLKADIAAAILLVDAKDDNAAAFYRRYGFLGLASLRNRLYLPVAEIAKMFAAAEGIKNSAKS